MILVVAAALIRSDGKVLVNRRPDEKEHGGLWEFPGGKVNAGENPEQALARELEEELAIRVDSDAVESAAFATGHGTHGAAPVVLILYTCTRWDGNPEGQEGNTPAWVKPEELEDLEMPPLDQRLRESLPNWL